MELTTEDRERIEQAVQRIEQEVHRVHAIWIDSIPTHEALFKMGEYATRYEREQQIKTLNRPGSKYYVSYDPDYKDKVFGVFNKEDLTQQGARKMAQQLNNLEAERSELIRRIKSILKASTVHDKISILEELEQLLNSLKTK